MNRFIAFYRIVYRSILFLLAIIIGSFISLFIQRSTMPPTGLSSTVTRFFHKILTKILGIKIIVAGSHNKAATLFVSNHISWLDIMVIGQIVPTHFLSMVEVKSWPIAGWLATKAGTLYIQRGGKKSVDTSLNEITQALNKKHNVVIFPEGRTTDGNLRKFHSRLLQSALDANAAIQPIALKYLSGGSKPTHPAVLFTGDTTVLQSFLRITSEKTITVEVTFLTSLSTTNQTRSDINNNAENQIRSHLQQLQ